MQPRTSLLLAALGLLAACATPQEQCIARETRDLRIVDNLLAETEANLRRGYALEEVTVWRPVWVDCTPRLRDGAPAAAPRMCFDDRAETVTRPSPIVPEAEAAKRDVLIEKRRQLLAQAERSIAACQAAYPEP
jgi:hypothetical protein